MPQMIPFEFGHSRPKVRVLEAINRRLISIYGITVEVYEILNSVFRAYRCEAATANDPGLLVNLVRAHDNWGRRRLHSF